MNVQVFATLVSSGRWPVRRSAALAIGWAPLDAFGLPPACAPRAAFRRQPTKLGKNAMRPLRMLAGTLALAAPILALLAAFYGALPWPLWGAIVLACAAVAAPMSYWRMPVPSHARDGRS
jgi:fatty acid desaturase